MSSSSIIDTGITLKRKKPLYRPNPNNSPAQIKASEKQKQIQPPNTNANTANNGNVNSENEPKKKTKTYEKPVELSVEEKIWDANGALVENPNPPPPPPPKVLTPEEEKAKENQMLKKRIQKNTKRAEDLGKYAEKLKQIYLDDDDDDLGITLKPKDSVTQKENFKANPREFYSRQQKSVKHRQEAAATEFEPHKPEISVGSKALLNKSPALKKRTIVQDYKRKKDEPQPEKYPFHPDQSATLNYPIRQPRFSLIDDMRLLNSISEAKQSTLVVEKELVFEEFDYGLQLQTNERDRNIKAKRALKRREKREQEKALQIKNPEPETPVKRVRKDIPKTQKELNQLFKLFKEQNETKDTKK